jgi:hypothetical protein
METVSSSALLKTEAVAAQHSATPDTHIADSTCLFLEDYRTDCRPPGHLKG